MLKYSGQFADAFDITLKIIDLQKYYFRGEETVKAVDGVDLEIARGEFISIIGPSGSGKTTIFNCIGALDKPTGGTVILDEIDLAELDTHEMAWLRCRKIGYIFQTYNIIPVMTALENVNLPMIFGGRNSDEAFNRSIEILKSVGLGDRLDHKVGELSGGQQQRVAIARAFSNNPAIILADEPTANLDRKTGEDIISILKKMNQEKDITIICATHDKKIIQGSDKVIWLRDGKIEKIQDNKN
jgi:putative ABC transport system ATP-binding protein